MRIAVINETSAADKNKDVLAALEDRGHTIINAGMTATGAQPELTYIQTGLLSAMLLNLNRVELVIGGCGTGQGYINAAMQYPNVVVGLIQNPLDAWLFGQINGGNCISLALNFGYGWAGDVNLRFIFDQLFSLDSFGQGYPAHRQESQQASRKTLADISQVTHKTMAQILTDLDDSVLQPVLDYSGVKELLDVETIKDQQIREVLAGKYQAVNA